jgi:hypothetical protein
MEWQAPVLVLSDQGHPLQVGPLRPFLAFVSRSLRPEDAPLVEPFVKRLRLWGLNPRTVGVNVTARDPSQVSPDVREWIAKCDCLVAVATPREALASGEYQPPDWIHSELGIAYGREKPFLLIHEASVRVGGLPERTGFRLPFEAAHPERAFPALDAQMPEIRAWCQVGRAASRRAGWIDLGTKALAVFGAIRLVQGLADPEEPTRPKRRKRGRSR